MADGSEDEEIISESDVFDPALYEELLRDLAPRARRSPFRPSGLSLFQSLGVNVIRHLLTYFPLPDFLRITTVCRWFYRIGNDPLVLSVYAPVELPAGDTVANLRSVFTAQHRQSALKKRPTISFHKEVFFSKECLEVVAVQFVASRLVLFSLWECRLVVWESREGREKRIGSYLTVEDVVDFCIDADGAVFVGAKELAYIRNKWVTSGFDDRKNARRTLDVSTSRASVRLVPTFPFIVLSLTAKVVIFSSDLEELRVFSQLDCNVLFRQLLTPRTSVPVALVAGGKQCKICFIKTGREVVKSFPKVKCVNRIEILSVPASQCAKQYLLVLDDLFSADLYANNRLLCRNVVTFHVQSPSVIVFARPYSFRVFTATCDSIKETLRTTYTATTYDFLLPACDKFACVVTEKYRYGRSTSPPISQTKISYFTSTCEVIKTEILLGLAADKAFATKNELVLVGEHESLTRCAVIVRYLRDASSREMTIEKAYEQFKCRELCRGGVVTAEQKAQQVLERRLENRNYTQKKRKRKTERKSRYWKSKLPRFARRFLSLEVVINR